MKLDYKFDLFANFLLHSLFSVVQNNSPIKYVLRRQTTITNQKEITFVGCGDFQLCFEKSTRLYES